MEISNFKDMYLAELQRLARHSKQNRELVCH
jgi:hypothetical protein